MNKHTHGPWEIEEGDLIVPPGGLGGRIAEVSGDTIEQRDANAALIAAAPDLLEAAGAEGTMDAAAQLLACFADGSIEDYERPEVAEVIEHLGVWAMKARAAIAKATQSGGGQ